MPVLATESFYLFLIKVGGQWMATTKRGRVCVVRNPALLSEGSPVIVWNAESASVPAADLFGGSDDPNTELDNDELEPR